MRLSDLQDKDVVDIISGERLGSIVDVEIANNTGTIEKIYIFNKKGFLNMVRGEENVILWKQIKKIGYDVILIDKNI